MTVVEHVFYCERADCDSHIRTAANAPMTGLLVTELPWSGRQDADIRWFCSWACVMTFAATVPDPERV